MPSSQPRQLLHYLFVTLAVVVALLSLLLSSKLVGEMAEEERRKIEIWAMATGTMVADEEADMKLVLKILQSNTTIPVILHDERSGEMLTHNIRLPDTHQDVYLRKKMAQFGSHHDPIVLKASDQLLYYDDSYTLKQLQVYPYFQLLVITFFIGLAFFALNRTQRAEQHRVWVGLSKETAHQLGTPISSLTAWIEYMKLKEVDRQLLTEIGKDISRLRMIAERFSKIGSIPDMQPTDLRDVITGTLRYLEKRLSTKISFSLLLPDHPVIISLNKPLMGWVIENLAKNAVDAMNGEGVVTISLAERGRHVLLDVSDTGKGIPKSKFKRIFSPGYTTKERGWGLGLSLVKRIVEVIHGWKIGVLTSEPGKETTFRIVFKKH